MRLGTADPEGYIKALVLCLRAPGRRGTVWSRMTGSHSKLPSGEQSQV